MKKQNFISYPCAMLIIVVLLGIWVYNYFQLWYYKDFYKEGVLKEVFHAKFSTQKCEFNSLLTQGGGDSKNRALNLNKNSAFLIAHAGGALIQNDKFFTYTNSKEALLQSINEGFEFIELDLMLDDEGDIFAAHDYEHFYKIANALSTQNTQTPPSKDYIRQTKIYERFTPLDKDNINEIFMQNPNVYLVTDKLNDFETIEKQLKFKDRLLIEIFSVKDYFKAKNMGFKYPMLSTNNIRLAMKLHIPMIVSHTSLLKNEINQRLSREYIQSGGCIMMYSSNEKEFIDTHKGKNATMFYTDFYDINNDKCKLSEKECKTY